MLNVDNEFDKLLLKKNNIKDIEKLPEKIKLSLEKSKNVEGIDNNIYKFVKECIEIENNINIINNINSNIDDIYKSVNIEFIFIPEEKEMNMFFNNIKQFGKIIIKNMNNSNLKYSSIIGNDFNNIKSLNRNFKLINFRGNYGVCINMD